MISSQEQQQSYALPVSFTVFSKIIENLPSIALKIQRDGIAGPKAVTLDECSKWYYREFYRNPSFIRPLYKFKLSACPSSMKKKVLQVSHMHAIQHRNTKLSVDGISSSEPALLSVRCRFPVPFAIFERYINKDELLQSLVEQNLTDSELRKGVLCNENIRRQILVYCYKSFYMNPSTRAKYKYSFQSVPVEWQSKIFEFGTISDELNVISHDSPIVSFEVFEKHIENLYDIVYLLKVNDPDFEYKGFEDCAFAYYLAFYTTPEIRKKYQYKLKPCTAAMKERLLVVPSKESMQKVQNLFEEQRYRAEVESEETVESNLVESIKIADIIEDCGTIGYFKFPVSYDIFKRLINYNELITQIMRSGNLTEKESPEMCEQAFRRYYHGFYLSTYMRKQYEYRFELANDKLRQILLNYAEPYNVDVPQAEAIATINTPILQLDASAEAGVVTQETQMANSTPNTPIKLVECSGLAEKSLADGTIRNTSNNASVETSTIVQPTQHMDSSLSKTDQCASDNDANIIHESSFDSCLPVTFKLFKRLIKNIDAIVQEMLSCQEYIGKSPEECALMYYKSFYTLPEIREKYRPQIKPCPVHIRDKLVSYVHGIKPQTPVSADDGPTNNLIGVNNTTKCIVRAGDIDYEFPVSFETFIKYINYDEIKMDIVSSQVKNNEKKRDGILKNEAKCLAVMKQFYRTFYVRHRSRTRFKFNFDAAPPHLREALLDVAKLAPITDNENAENQGEPSSKNTSLKLAKDALEHQDEPGGKSTSRQLAERGLENQYEPGYKNTTLELQENSQINKSNESCTTPENVNADSLPEVSSPRVTDMTSIPKVNVMHYMPQNMSAYITRKIEHLPPKRDLLNEHFIGTAKQQITTSVCSVANEQSVFEKAKESLFFTQSDKRHNIRYLLGTNFGTKQIIWSILSQLSFEEFKNYTNIYNAEPFYTDDDVLRLCYNHAVVKGNWPKNVHVKMQHFGELLQSKGIKLDTFNLQHFSPKMLHWSELLSFTNFEQIVEREYVTRTGSEIKDIVSLFKESERFYSSCWCHDQWIGSTPKVTNSELNINMGCKQLNKTYVVAKPIPIKQARKHSISSHEEPAVAPVVKQEDANLSTAADNFTRRTNIVLPKKMCVMVHSNVETQTQQLPISQEEKHIEAPGNILISHIDDNSSVSTLNATNNEKQSMNLNNEAATIPHSTPSELVDRNIGRVEEEVLQPATLPISIKPEPVDLPNNVRFAYNMENSDEFTCETICEEEQVINLDDEHDVLAEIFGGLSSTLSAPTQAPQIMTHGDSDECSGVAFGGEVEISNPPLEESSIVGNELNDAGLVQFQDTDVEESDKHQEIVNDIPAAADIPAAISIPIKESGPELPVNANRKLVKGILRKAKRIATESVPPKKRKLMIQNVQQLTHEFRALPLNAVQGMIEPTMSRVTQPTSGNKTDSLPEKQQIHGSQPQLPTVTASQVLAVDNSLFDSTQLRALLDAPHKVNENDEPQDILVDTDTDNRELTESPGLRLHSVIVWRSLKQYLYIKSLAPSHINQFTTICNAVGEIYQQALIASEDVRCYVYGPLLQTCFQHCSASLLTDLQCVLDDLGEFFYTIRRSLSVSRPADLRARVLEMFMDTAPIFAHITLKFENDAREWANCNFITTDYLDIVQRKRSSQLVSAIRPAILQRIKEFKELP